MDIMDIDRWMDGWMDYRYYECNRIFGNLYLNNLNYF